MSGQEPQAASNDIHALQDQVNELSRELRDTLSDVVVTLQTVTEAYAAQQEQIEQLKAQLVAANRTMAPAYTRGTQTNIAPSPDGAPNLPQNNQNKVLHL